MIISYEKSIVDIVLEHGTATPERSALIFDQGTGPLSHYTYAELANAICRVAGALVERGLAGRRIAMLFAPGTQFVVALLGVMAAGSVAVPIAPIGRRRARLQNLLTTLCTQRPDCLLLDDAMAAQFGTDLFPALADHAIAYVEFRQLEQASARFQPVACAPAALAVLQYTSGTTAASKGVMITHGNIIANETMIRHAFGHDRDSHFVGWVPHFHDQGLFGNILQPLFLGSTCVLTSPAAFIDKPLTWLQLIAKYGAHSSGGPNFGYDLCVDHAMRKGVPDIDLSSWKVAFNGAERIRPATLDRFGKCFAAVGFDKRAFLPCYGLAESTLVTIAISPLCAPLVRSFDSAALADGRACETAANMASIDLVCCGPAMAGSTVAIADGASGTPLPDLVVGEIWVRGPHIAQGYLGDDATTRDSFGAFLDNGVGPYLRTGDLGFSTSDGYYIVGRLKDVINLRGRKFSPCDIEDIWLTISGVVGPGVIGWAKAAAVQIEMNAVQHVALIAEIKRADARKLTNDMLQTCAKTLRTALMERLELGLTDLLIVPEGSIPRTTSGKIQRMKAAQLIMSGEIRVIEAAGPLSRLLQAISEDEHVKLKVNHLSG